MIYLEQGREPVSWLSLLRKNEGARGDTSRDLSVRGWGPALASRCWGGKRVETWQFLIFLQEAGQANGLAGIQLCPWVTLGTLFSLSKFYLLI